MAGWLFIDGSSLYKILDLIGNLQTLAQIADFLVRGTRIPLVVASNLIPVVLLIVGLALIARQRPAQAATAQDEGTSGARAYLAAAMICVAVIGVLIAAGIAIVRNTEGPCKPKEPKSHNLDDEGWTDIVAPFERYSDSVANEIVRRTKLCRWKKLGDVKIVEITSEDVVKAQAAQGKIQASMKSDDTMMVQGLHVGSWPMGNCQVTGVARNAVDFQHCIFSPPPTATSTPEPTPTPSPTPTRAGQ